MRPEVKKAVLTKLAKHEGRIAYIYPDSKGNPTVGLGHLLSNLQAAAQLPFVLAGTTTPATPAQIVYAWNYVKNRQVPYREIVLLDKDIDALALTDLEGFEPIMQRTFPETDLPLSAETALWDMVYNLGSFKEFPRLVAAVHMRNWRQAAEECIRRDVGAGRNDDTKADFLAALTRPMEQAV